ncbi:MAG: hypothetical protein ABIN67_15995 [Ferruginibacter sp.]
MKKRNFLLFIPALFIVAFSFSSCKGKDKKETDATTETTTAIDTPAVTTTAPVMVNDDEALRKGVTDATKDYPGVKAEVSDSVIVLSGEIKRADWKKLNPTLNSLHPKRIKSDDLTIK